MHAVCVLDNAILELIMNRESWICGDNEHV
jgi:hypothetical protein